MASFNKNDYNSSDDDMNREWAPSSDDSEPETARNSPNRGDARSESGSSGNISSTGTGRDAELLPPFKPGPSPAWKALGFVAPDGVGDMSKTGVLAMRALAYAVERHEQAVRASWHLFRVLDSK